LDLGLDLPDEERPEDRLARDGVFGGGVFGPVGRERRGLVGP